MQLGLRTPPVGEGERQLPHALVGEGNRQLPWPQRGKGAAASDEKTERKPEAEASGGEQEDIERGESSQCIEVVEVELGTKRCVCRGNCGSRVHKAIQARNSRSPNPRPICSAQAMPGFDRCWRCKCEVPACGAGRLPGEQGWRRWCAQHAMPLKANQYWTPLGGLQSFGAGWPLVIKVLAKSAHVLPLTMPMDFVALKAYALEAHVVEAGRPVDSWALTWLFFAHSIKWL